MDNGAGLEYSTVPTGVGLLQKNLLLLPPTRCRFTFFQKQPTFSIKPSIHDFKHKIFLFTLYNIIVIKKHFHDWLNMRRFNLLLHDLLYKWCFNSVDDVILYYFMHIKQLIIEEIMVTLSSHIGKKRNWLQYDYRVVTGDAGSSISLKAGML